MINRMTAVIRSVLILSINIHVCTCTMAKETRQIRRKNFADTFDFILGLKENSESVEEFITKVQAVFCPNQPVCGTGDNHAVERSDVLASLNPAVTIGNKTEKLTDMASVFGICCVPCDCSNSCEIKGNCCPLKQHVNSTRAVTDMGFSCIQASSAGFDIADYYFMVNRCYGDRSNETLLVQCEAPESFTMDQILPVTSTKTGHTYWNKYCATCNADVDVLLPWRAYVIFKHPPIFYGDYLRYPTTIEQLQRATARSLIYSPPLAMNNNVCLPKSYAGGCDTPIELLSNDSMFLINLCNDYFSPLSSGLTGAQVVVRNIFCLFCNRFRSFELRKVEETKCSGDDSRLSESGITGLLDYTDTNSKSIQQTFHEQGYQYPMKEGCMCNEVYDGNEVLYYYKQ